MAVYIDVIVDISVSSLDRIFQYRVYIIGVSTGSTS